MSPPAKPRSPWTFLAALVVLVGAYFGLDLTGVLEDGSAEVPVETPAPPARPSTVPAAEAPAVPAEDDAVDRIRAAFAERRSDLWITLEARVERTLQDDDDGARHQRFILRLADDLTVLVAHNIDLAPRVPLAVGDRIRLYGEYEWNPQGGVIHWTHAYADGRPRGWIEHAGQRYQ